MPNGSAPSLSVGVVSLSAALLGFLAGRTWPAATPDGSRAAHSDAGRLPRRLQESHRGGQCALDRACAYSIDEDTLETQVQVARLPLVPEQFRERIIIELGANTVYTVRDTLLKQPKFRGHFVVSFEPLLDK